jgi:hypothetical protein
MVKEKKKTTIDEATKEEIINLFYERDKWQNLAYRVWLYGAVGEGNKTVEELKEWTEVLRQIKSTTGLSSLDVDSWVTINLGLKSYWYDTLEKEHKFESKAYPSLLKLTNREYGKQNEIPF